MTYCAISNKHSSVLPESHQSVVYDDLDHHIAAAGSIERACVPMGMYLAWCANLHLISEQLQQSCETLLLRLRYREVTGSELLVAGCAGRLTSDCLNAQGNQFTDRYYATFLDDFRAVFGEDIYGVADDWAHYDQLSRILTRHYMVGAEKSRGGFGRRGSKWWKFWT